ncbi:MAG TPA: acyl-CoA dehydrogenase family protein [Planctomycetota bacterium]|nr:acyl-CoA dehydrogenase family protein [Planctomycetota bacterium]
MPEYRGVDYLELDELLSEEERMVRDTTRDFVSEHVMPIIGEAYEKAEFPRQLIPMIGELGLLGANLPEEYGCAGMGAVAYGLICQELERGDSGLRSFVSVQGSLVMWPILTYGSEEQKRRWLPEMAKGKAIGCFGLTEPDHGSDPAGMETKARREGKDWVLNGAKMWITNGTVADVALVWARTDDDIQGFLVEKGTKGFSAPEQKRKYSLRASVTSELVLDHVRVPDSARLPGVKGLKGPLNCLTQARYGIAWGAIGAAQACYDEALHYSKGREQFGKPLAGFQLVQAKLAHMLSEISKMQLVAWRVGRLKEAGKARPQHVSLAKRNNVGEALKIARMARDMLGANGITAEYQCMRHMCNLESVFTYEGTHDIHTLILGQDVTGISAFG